MMVATQHEGDTERPLRGAEAPRRILVTDDDEAVGRMMRRMLRGYGEVTVASDPAEALRLLAVEEFDVVTCDLMMPGISGYALLSFAKEQCPGARRVLITGSVLSDPESELYDAWLLKPFSRAELVEAIVGAG